MKIFRQNNFAKRGERSLPTAVSTKAGNLFLLSSVLRLLSSVFLICSCFSFVGVSSAADINTPAGMTAYLKRQKLPALKAIDLWENRFGTGLKLTTAHYEI